MSDRPPLEILAARVRLVQPDDAALIRYQLSLANHPREIKNGLQRLCGFYDAGIRLSEPLPIRQLVLSLVWHDQILVRRWSYKALSYVGQAADDRILLACLREEQDAENTTWAMAALIAVSRGRQVEDVCNDLGLSQTTALLLAARLHPKNDWLLADIPPINVDRADPLTLKWAALLEGYLRAPENLFGNKHSNGQVMRALNGHHAPEVSEYSIWALWKHPSYSLSDLATPAHEFASRPPNVRRWINRLLTKDPSVVGQQVDLIDELRRDEEMAAREGLAIGLRRAFTPELSIKMLDWLDVEIEEPVKRALLEHMAANSNSSSEYWGMVEERFVSATGTSGLRPRLLAAAQQTPLYPVLKRIELIQAAASAQVDLFLPPLLHIQGNINMNTFNVGGNLNANNLSGGDMVNVASTAISQVPDDRSGEREFLKSVLELMSTRDAETIPGRGEIILTAKEVAEAPSAENKGRLMNGLKAITAGAGAATGLMEQVGKLIEIGSSVFS